MTGAPVCQIELEFGDGTYLFRLGLAQIAELERNCGAPIGAVFARVLKGRYRLPDGMTFGNPEEGAYSVLDLIECVRLGLIGGGEGVVNGSPVKVDVITARRLADAYVANRPLKEGWTLAAAILGACIEGYVDPSAAPLKKKRVKSKKASSITPAPS